MQNQSYWIAGSSPALSFAAEQLHQAGFSCAADPAQAQMMLYDTPTPAFVQEEISRSPLVIGGNLDLLDPEQPRLDLLKDPWYLARNGELTAQAALGLLLPQLQDSFSHSPVLILGWGRIGRCLERLLRQLGIPVSVYTRKEADQAMLYALGGFPVEREELSDFLPRCAGLINTAPAQILTTGEQALVPQDCIVLELASVRALTCPQTNWARGLPGKYKAPASGRLIAQTILRHYKEVL